jgi:hypothetical protein
VTVTIISGGFHHYETTEDGEVVGVWQYKVNVDGRLGYNGYAITDEESLDYFGVPADDPSIGAYVQQGLIEWLEEDANREGGMASLDGTPTDGLSVSDDSDDSDDSDGTVVADGSSTDGSSNDGSAVTDGSDGSDGGDGNSHTGTIGEST